MSLLVKNIRRSPLSVLNSTLWRFNSTTAETSLQNDDEEFRVLDIRKSKQRLQRRTARRSDVQPDRIDRMDPEQNWGNVWPGPKTFHPSSVPLPLRQGYVPKGQAPPGKKANAELMKIPNFLHLTPPAIKTQCEALKKYCTEWPKLLTSEDAIEKHYPIEIITSYYCHASPSIRNPLGRIVTLRVKLASLNLDRRATDKFLRLLGDRYDKETDLVTITADRCPVRKQNLEYVNYLLTACYHEAWTVEDWETEKSEEDMEVYIWERNQSKRNLVDWWMKKENQQKQLTAEEYKTYDVAVVPNSENYKNAVSSIYNEGENATTISNYKNAVKKLLGLPENVVDKK